MKIEKVTFTGADESTSPYGLIDITEQYPYVEWGILDSLNKRGIEPRYPSRNWIDLLLKAKENDAVKMGVKMNLAHHICGKTAKEFISGKYDFRWHFDRIQINRILPTPDSGQGFEKFQAMCRRVNEKGTSILVQLRGHGHENDIKTFKHLRQEGIDCGCLFDKSGGKGKTPTGWPTPINGAYCGYAGGLNPDNLEESLREIEEVVGDRRVWIDMETGVRSDDNLFFDLNKVLKCLEIVEQFKCS